MISKKELDSIFCIEHSYRLMELKTEEDELLKGVKPGTKKHVNLEVKKLDRLCKEVIKLKRKLGKDTGLVEGLKTLILGVLPNTLNLHDTRLVSGNEKELGYRYIEIEGINSITGKYISYRLYISEKDNKEVYEVYTGEQDLNKGKGKGYITVGYATDRTAIQEELTALKNTMVLESKVGEGTSVKYQVERGKLKLIGKAKTQKELIIVLLNHEGKEKGIIEEFKVKLGERYRGGEEYGIRLKDGKIEIEVSNGDKYNLKVNNNYEVEKVEEVVAKKESKKKVGIKLLGVYDV